MKRITKLLALALVLSLLFTLCACSKDQKGIAGTWKYSIDFEKVLSSGDADLAALGQLGDGMADMFKGLSMVVILDLKEDNSFKFSFDEASAKAAVEGMMSKMGEILPSLVAGISGMSEEDFKAAMDAQGITMDDLMEQFMGQVNTDEIVEELVKQSKEGSYRFEDGKLYLTESGETEKADQYLSVELNGNELKVVDVPKGDDFEGFKSLLPLVFTR